jgi:hypothetical protein
MGRFRLLPLPWGRIEAHPNEVEAEAVSPTLEAQKQFRSELSALFADDLARSPETLARIEAEAKRAA